MEFEVRSVGGIENCFVSLPLTLIQSLQSSRSGLLPPVLTLELRSLSSSSVWFVAWSGATSSLPAIEVAQQFADSISLPDRITVRVRAVSGVPKASLVTIEPHSEDDWEVLELNAELAEAAILNQVRIVQEGMRFPLWLSGRTIITFSVASTIPKKVVVQLVPGSEVAVAPKRRNKITDSSESLKTQSCKEDHKKVLLRVQDLDRGLMYKSICIGTEIGVVLTSVAFIHPETAKSFSLDSLQLVAILPKFPSKDSAKHLETKTLRTSNDNSISREALNGHLSDQKESSVAIVYLLASDLVTKGHIMIADSQRIYLQVSLHSWVYLIRCSNKVKKDFSSVSVSPCRFKMFENDKARARSGLRELDSHKDNRRKNMLRLSDTYMHVVDWSTSDEFISALSCLSNEGLGAFNHSVKEKAIRSLLTVWFTAHLDAIASYSGVEVKSLFLGSQSLLQFEAKGFNFGNHGNVGVSSYNSLGNRSKTVILHQMNISEESSQAGKFDVFELAFDEQNKNNVYLGGVELFGKLNVADPVSFDAVKETLSGEGIRLDESLLNWMGPTLSEVTNRMMVLLSPVAGRSISSYNFPLPGHVIICGPPGSGKTLLTRAVAKTLQDHEEILVHPVFIRCSQLALEKPQNLRQSLSSYISEALDHAPSIVIFDDLDIILSSYSDSEGSQPSTSMVALTEFLADIMDEYGEKRRSTCGIGPIAFLASVQALDKIPQSLSSSGRFDFHVQLPAPAASQRGAILKHEIERRSIECSDDILQDVASKCDGFDAYDLEILVDRAVHSAVGRFLPASSSLDKQEQPCLLKDDFTLAMHEYLPVSMRDITKPAAEGGRSGWDNVGGLIDIRNTIKEMIELPSKFPSTFAQSPLRLRANVLLYGPPGCGKTHIVGAAAAACSLRFLSVKGPELLNKYIGASEQAVRDIFSKAAAAAPCLLFFDEFDSIAPKRGHDNTGVTDRVVNQFLTELDGVEVLTGVFVFAATSRPDLLDAALLRPGRLDRLLFCDFPALHERLDILQVLSKKLPMASDVDLKAVAKMTEGFSGADLQALLSDAQLAAVHEILGTSDTSGPTKKPIITDTLLKSTASKARPSVSEIEKQRLYTIYSQFLESKRSIAAQSRDAKGKRATLA